MPRSVRFEEKIPKLTLHMAYAHTTTWNRTPTIKQAGRSRFSRLKRTAISIRSVLIDSFAARTHTNTHSPLANMQENVCIEWRCVCVCAIACSSFTRIRFGLSSKLLEHDSEFRESAHATYDTIQRLTTEHRFILQAHRSAMYYPRCLCARARWCVCVRCLHVVRSMLT